MLLLRYKSKKIFYLMCTSVHMLHYGQDRQADRQPDRQEEHIIGQARELLYGSCSFSSMSISRDHDRKIIVRNVTHHTATTNLTTA